jgi:hypothetical protein
VDDEWIDCGCRNLERPCIHARAQAAKWLMEHDGTHPGDFIGYHSCQSRERVDMLRPESGDWHCEKCNFTMALFGGTVEVVAEGTPLW